MPLADSEIAAIAVAPADLAATVVRERDGALDYIPLGASSDRSTAEIELLPGDRATLIIARTGDGDASPLRYQYAVTPADGAGGGCQTAPARGAPLAPLIALLLIGWRRRSEPL